MSAIAKVARFIMAEQYHNLASTSVLRILPHPTLDEQVLSLARYARAAVGHNRWRAWAPPKRALGHGSLIRATRIHLLPSLSLS